MARDQHGEEQQHPERAPCLQVERLEAAEPDGAHHQQRRNDHEQQRRQRRAELCQALGVREDRGRENARRRRARHTHEIALVRRRGLNVESRQPQRRCGHEQEGRRPSEATERAEAPRERQHGGRHPERDDVGHRVELHAELAGSPRHPRDAPVEHVEHDSDADERRGHLELTAHRVDDARVAAEHVAHREEAGQDGDAATRMTRRRVVGRRPGHGKPERTRRSDGLHQAPLLSPPRRAMRVTPLSTRSPTCTAIVASGGR